MTATLHMPGTSPRRRWLATEVVQTSAMDCGPAALKCLLEGMGIPASYGRLREACQTSVDGTSVDALEAAAGPLGLVAQQVMIPVDHLFLPEAAALPAMAVVRQPDGANHFVVVWRRVGRWVQVMDPASGRRWVACASFTRQLLQHRLSVPAVDWRAWASTQEFTGSLRHRIARLDIGRADAQAWLAQALADEGWFSLGALDAAVRMVEALVRAGGLARGRSAARLVQATVDAARSRSDDIFGVVPAAYWSATPDPSSVARGALHLSLEGAVLLRVRGRLPAAVPDAEDGSPTPRSAELDAALHEPPPRPWALAWSLLRHDGLLGPLALAVAMLAAAGALVIEALLLRGVLDIAAQLGLPMQRLLAIAALAGFAAVLLLLEVPIVGQSMRFGRHLEVRLRAALLAKLPRLNERYFHSRPVSDMADRAHALQLTRGMPSLGLHLLQGAAELVLTLAGLAWIAPASIGFALAIAAGALVMPLLLQPWLAERDLRARNQAGALHGCTLDALLGAVPLRTHQADTALRRRHEGLLVAWVQARRAQIRLALAADGVLGLWCMGLTGAMLVDHFLRQGGVGGADLLIVYWALKLPALGNGLSGLLQQLPAQRNVLLRLMEPLAAPEDGPREGVAARAGDAARTDGASVRLDGGRVVAAGHLLLRDLSVSIRAGEHVAVVGASGAGKSTLMGLLLGWHRCVDGRLEVDGSPLDEARLTALRRHTAWVDPAVQLWNRSLLDNLRMACDDEGLDRVAAVIEAAGLREVLRRLPNGLQSTLGEGGALLSGGEGQRVRLGRAFMQTGVRLALLDEPFRGLDRTQRAALLGEARRWWRAATLVFVTHDIGDTAGFDRVLVMDAGRLVEDGPPAALLAAGGIYARLREADAALHGVWRRPGWRQLWLAEGRLRAAKGHTP